MESKTYKNIIFDLGGVLIEWEPVRHLTQLAQPIHFVEVFSSLLWASHDGGILSRKEVIDKLPSQYDRVAFEYFVNNISSFLRPIPDMVRLLHELKEKQYKIYILSNMPKENHEEFRDVHTFLGYTDGAVYSYEVGAVKPQPFIYHTLLNKYQLAAHESIFIDDREENIDAGIQLGIDGIVCKSPTQVRSELKQRQIIL